MCIMVVLGLDLNQKLNKYDFIISIILQSINKKNFDIKKYKPKLEKKRLKEFKQIMGLI